MALGILESQALFLPVAKVTEELKLNLGNVGFCVSYLFNIPQNFEDFTDLLWAKVKKKLKSPLQYR